jgi:hypothetical protein
MIGISEKKIEMYLLEKGNNGILIHGKMEVAWSKHQGKVGTSFSGEPGLCNDIACALPSTPKSDWKISTAGFNGNLSSELD